MILHRAHCLWLALAISITGCGMSAKGAQPMTNSAKSSPLCVGRLVISLPVDAKPVLDATFQFMETQQPKAIANYDELKRQVDVQIKQFEAVEIKRDSDSDRFWKRAGFDPDKIFGKTQLIGSRIDDSVQQTMLGYLSKPDLPSTITEVHKFVDGQEYVFLTEGGGADSYPTTSNRMWNAALNFQPLASGTVPTAPGFCVAGGMFADNGQPPSREDFTLVTSFKQHPDARFVIDGFAIDSIDKGEPSLKHRADSELRILRANVEGKVDVLLRGHRKVADQDGYQIGLSVPNDTVPGTTAYKFFWSAEGVPNDASRPFMEVSLTIQPEDEKPSSFADASQATALWDALLQNLRIRPGAVVR